MDYIREFNDWWHGVGSALLPETGHDMEQHGKRMANEFAKYLAYLELCEEKQDKERE